MLVNKNKMSNINKIDYGKWTLKQLAAELKCRKVKCTGKKAELVERLIYLDKIFIKSHPLEEEIYTLNLPDAKLYKYVNSSHNINLQTNFDIEYLKSVQSSLHNEKGKKMYEDRYLLSLRKADCNNEIFLSARVASEYRKSVVYSIDLKISPYQYLSDVQYECAQCLRARILFTVL